MITNYALMLVLWSQRMKRKSAWLAISAKASIEAPHIGGQKIGAKILEELKEIVIL